MTGRGALSPTEVVAWAEGAQPGETKVYAWGDPDFPRAAPGVVAAKRLHAKGLIDFTSRTSDGRREYLMRRIVTRARQTRGMIEQKREAEERSVMTILRRAAADGRPCPSDERIAELADLEDAHSTQPILSRLRERRLIFVSYVGSLRRRVITIGSSGARTKMERVQ